ncbi:hypothetical protein Ddye_023372 [Dipteronia dyeriana]|uniref:HAT C-terminal dimerisation domain-containing protein n=1 Tax=Dipteronia dyeriana TaxID=168575 RepID=A0AAD9WS24_9ROSI|nr:hypothetical protein Ddye_023372 [Dipteronia dyeriana]
MVASGELKTGRGANQIRVLQQAVATRWSSHFNSVIRLIEMFDATSCVIENIENELKQYTGRDFSGSEIGTLRRQLEHYELNVPNDSKFQNISSLSELCHRLFETKMSEHFHLIDRLIRLVLIIPVSTTTTERAFSAMKLIKTTLHNKMEDEFLASCMMIYIEREFSDTIDPDMIIDEFCVMGPRRVSLKQNSDALVL